MDQVKIGRFIAQRRKSIGLTQVQVAEMLNITDRAVSRWETGRALPDSSIMLELCQILGITVNDLLSGEVVSMKDYDKERENKLIQFVKEKEATDRRMLAVEIVLGVLSSLVLFAFVLLAAFIQMQTWLRVTLCISGFVIFIIGCSSAIKIEQVAGYYECSKCGYRYVPAYKNVFFAPHFGRIRYMSCPQCGKKSWQKKKVHK